MSRTGIMRIIAALLVWLPTTGATAQDDDEKSLEKCQRMAGRETAKFATGYQKSVTKCTDKIARERVRNVAADAAGAARSCIAALRKLEHASKPDKTLIVRAADSISKVCDPNHPDSKAEHSSADVLGTGAGATVSGDSIEASVRGAWCDDFGVGGGVIDSVQEWIDCQLAAATCQARQQLIAEVPNLVAWLADVRPAIEAIDPNDAKVIDALAALDALDSAIDVDDNGTPDINCGPGVDAPLVCGNGIVEPGEDCELGNLDGADCDSATGSTLPNGRLTCGAGCAFDTSACVTRFVDNGDGTITDHQTGLTWEKKTDDGSIHDVDDTYTWTDPPGGEPDGTAFTTFLTTLNDCTSSNGTSLTGGFAGHCDWRLPNVLELKSIVDCSGGAPCVAPIFGDSAAAAYWSATTSGTIETAAWLVSFNNGSASDDFKSVSRRVRAVRGGP